MILLVSNSRDFAADYVVAALRRRQLAYYRLDLDLVAADCVLLDPVEPSLVVERGSGSVRIDSASLTAVYYHAPTHLRESSGGRYGPEELLARHQWAAFARSLTVFDGCTWVNHPRHTYSAENKPYQLLAARRAGFAVPATRVGNARPLPSDAVWGSEGRVAVKALDTFLLRVGGEDAFFYTQCLPADELARYSLAEMPLILQRELRPKVDLRVTVVGDHVYPVAVVEGGLGIDGDWRLRKGATDFVPHDLPPGTAACCVRLVKDLGLAFGAIDLALVGGVYYFLEVNPTGEWFWLVDRLGLPIPEALTDALCSGRTPAAG